MSNNIYEQAIADAKMLREIAEQNAKNAIIEAITPRVRELIDNELTNSNPQESISESFDNTESDEIVLEESAIMELAKEVASNSSQTSPDANSILDLLNEIKAEDSDGDECDACGTIKRGKGPGCENAECSTNKKEKKKKDVEESMQHYEQYNQQEEDMNLEELLNEIKMEIDLDIEDEEIEEALKELMPTIKILDDEGEAEEAEEADLEDNEGEAEGEEGEEDGEEFKLPDLPDFDLGAEKGEEKEKAEESYEINEGLLELELKRLRKNRSAGNNNETRTLNESSYQKKILQEKRQNHLLREKLDEYRGAVENLRDQLNEMNLFNAKLLYVNKLLQTKGLGASQKKTIIESIDNAESLREVKLVYKTLSESVSRKTDTLNETKIRKLAGSSSRPTRSGGTLITESSASGQVDRWARLAGLK